MLRPAGFSDDSFSEDESYEYTKGSILKTELQEIKDETTSTKTGEVGSEDQKSQETDLMIAKADLAQAIEAGDLEAVTSVLAPPGMLEVNTPLDVWGWGRLTPAGLACCHGQVRVLALLASWGAHCHGEGFILLASAGGDSGDQELVECAQLLKDIKEESVNRVQRQGMTALMMACRRGREPLVEWMVNNGAEIDKKDNKGWSALMFSVDSGRGDIARILLKCGAKAGHINHDGQTAADIAAGADRSELQDILETFTGDRGRLRSKQFRGVEHESKMVTVLKNLEMEHLIEVFKKEKVDLETFLVMTEADLSKLCCLGDTKNLLFKQAELHKAEWSRLVLARLNNVIK